MKVPRLHVVTDDAVLSRSDFVRRAEAVLDAGGGKVALHVRGPRTPGRRLHDAASSLMEVVGRRGGWLMVNDRIDVALAVGARGVHLGTRSLSPPDARALLGPGGVIGVSIPGVDDLRRREAAGPGPVATGPDPGVAYLFVGHVFETPTHPGRPGGGREMVASVAAAADVPVVAIGGITVERVADVVRWGAHGAAVIRGVWDAPDPGEAVEGYLTELGDAPT